MKMKKKRLWGILLSFVLVLGGVMPGMSLTAKASSDPYYSLLNTTKVTFKGHEWYIIADDCTNDEGTDGTVTLLAAGTSFGSSKFSDSWNNNYSQSIIKAALDTMTASGGSFADVADAIEDTDNGKLYLLSTEEAGNLLVSLLDAGFTCQYKGWWLRSPSPDNTPYALFVRGDTNGVYTTGKGMGSEFGVRPALKLNLSKVTFDSENNKFLLATEVTEWDSGDCHLSFDSTTGTMTVSKRTDEEAPGGGKMDDYTGTETLPWDSVKGSITSVVIQDGVTGIGDYAFNLCSNMASITIPASVTSIGKDAFHKGSTTSLTATFTRPAAEGTLAVGDNAFYHAYCYFNYGGEGKYVLFDGDTEIKAGDLLQKLNGSSTYDSLTESDVNTPKTLTWKIPTFSITDKSENGSVTAKVDGAAVTTAQRDDTVVLTVTPDSGYQFKEITVAAPKASIEELADLISVMGTAEFTDDNNQICKVSDNHFVLLEGDNIKAELSSEAGLSQVNTSSYKAESGNYSWQFVVDENNRITMIFVEIPKTDGLDETIFSSDWDQQSNGKLPETPFEYTTVTEGKEYSFTMPNKNVTVTAEFEEIPGFTATFDANGGTGTMADVTGISGEWTLPDCSFTAPEGKAFEQWKITTGTSSSSSSSDPAMSGTVSAEVYRKPGETITVSSNITVTAQWKDSISQTVTFKVVNGSWDDGTTADKTVTLTGYEGDMLKLAADKIPAVGTKPNDTYKAGSWDVEPGTETAITKATTYTYTYTQKEAAVVTKAPTAKTLTYNGQEQELVTAGAASNGAMQYKLGESGTYSTEIPKAANAGDYKIYYKAVGDSGYIDSAEASVDVTIAKAAVEDKTVEETIEVSAAGVADQTIDLKDYLVSGAGLAQKEDGSGFQAVLAGDLADYVSLGGMEGTVLTYSVAANGGGLTGKAVLAITSINYADYTITINLASVKKVTEVVVESGDVTETAVNSVEVPDLSGFTDAQPEAAVEVKMEVKLESTEKVEQKIGATVLNKIEESVTKAFGGVSAANLAKEYLDITVTKSVDGGTAQTVADVNRVLEIAVGFDLTGKYNPVIVREHGGAVSQFTKLSARPAAGSCQDGTFYVEGSGKTAKIYIYARYFSTYTVAYTTTASYQVTFDDTLGNVNQVVVAGGNKVTKPADPVRSGYDFAGWYIGETKTAWNFDSAVADDMTLKAHWSEQTKETAEEDEEQEPEETETEEQQAETPAKEVRSPKTNDRFPEYPFWIVLMMAGIAVSAGGFFSKKIKG